MSLYNVRHLYDVAGRRELGTMQPGSSCRSSLAFIDLDQFKLVNDVHGHLVGSELLGRTGQRLRELSRKQDWCFRYGGDEFVVLMPETGAEDALILASKVLGELMNTRFHMKNGLELNVRASVGLATAPADGATVHAGFQWRRRHSRMYAWSRATAAARCAARSVRILQLRETSFQRKKRQGTTLVVPIAIQKS